ncbi:MAG TPA: nucleotidyltransferase family protein [Acidimicrobiales bacterium]|nr:nucleotidyltransferase family protein [Acidimicrobiales bacterium]
MKAVLLAAGLGTRLRPLTDTSPKCLLAVDGVTLLDRWLDALAGAGVDEVLVNTHHCPDLVDGHLATRAGPPRVRTVFEPVLLGSAGTLLANRAWIGDDPSFLACNADNLTDFDPGILVRAHLGAAPRPVATVALFHTRHPSACGIVQRDGDGTIVEFAEKPARPVGNLANAGIYAFETGALERCRGGDGPLDIGFHLLPHLVGQARSVLVEGFFLDIGTLEDYRAAQVEWPARGAA